MKSSERAQRVPFSLQTTRLRDVVPFLSLIVVLGIFVVLIPSRFATLQNLTLILQQSAITMTVGFGMTFVIVAGSIDLSVGSLVALTPILSGAPSVGSAISGSS